MRAEIPPQVCREEPNAKPREHCGSAQAAQFLILPKNPAHQVRRGGCLSHPTLRGLQQAIEVDVAMCLTTRFRDALFLDFHNNREAIRILIDLFVITLLNFV